MMTGSRSLFLTAEKYCLTAPLSSCLSEVRRCWSVNTHSTMQARLDRISGDGVGGWPEGGGPEGLTGGYFAMHFLTPLIIEAGKKSPMLQQSLARTHLRPDFGMQASSSPRTTADTTAATATKTCHSMSNTADLSQRNQRLTAFIVSPKAGGRMRSRPELAGNTNCYPTNYSFTDHGDKRMVTDLDCSLKL